MGMELCSSLRTVQLCKVYMYMYLCTYSSAWRQGYNYSRCSSLEVTTDTCTVRIAGYFCRGNFIFGQNANFPLV